MARGWESKAIEIQIEDAHSARRSAAPERTPDEIAQLREREGLELSRVRVMHDLESAKNPRYQAMLRQALAHLDQKLAVLPETR